MGVAKVANNLKRSGKGSTRQKLQNTRATLSHRIFPSTGANYFL